VLVTVDDLVLYLNRPLDGLASQSASAALIDAEAEIEGHLGRCLSSEEVEQTVEAEGRWGASHTFVLLDRRPVTAVASVTVSGYAVPYKADRTGVWIPGNGPCTVVVTYTGGYDDDDFDGRTVRTKARGILLRHVAGLANRRADGMIGTVGPVDVEGYRASYPPEALAAEELASLDRWRERFASGGEFSQAWG
jgi:hypothetical protein